MSCLCFSTKKDPKLPSTKSLLFITNGGLLGQEFCKGARVCILDKAHRYHGKIGRIYFIHNKDEVWVQFDDDYVGSEESNLSDAIKVTELTLIPPLYAGYLYEYSNQGFFNSWKRKYVESWDTHLSFREDESTFDLSLQIKFGRTEVCLVDHSQAAKYPFGNKTPKLCTDFESQLAIIKTGGSYTYIMGDVSEVAAFKVAIRKGIDISTEMSRI